MQMASVVAASAVALAAVVIAATLLSRGDHTGAVPIRSLPRRAGFVASIDGNISAGAFRTAGFDAGFGMPVVLRGAARHSSAFTLWATDDMLVKAHGDETLMHVETKVETRMTRELRVTKLRDFLSEYNTSDSYLVAQAPRGLGADLSLPPLLACRDRVPFLSKFVVWMSSGGTKSKVHYDFMDNLLCMLDGTKSVMLWDVVHKLTVESDDFSWWIAPRRAESSSTYGEYADIDVGAVDPHTTPGFFDTPWVEATLTAGDCLFIPTGWYHHVDSHAGRNLAYNFWWSRDDRPVVCEAPTAEHLPVRASDCSWRYDGPPELTTPPEPARASELSGCEAAFGPPEQVRNSRAQAV